MIRIRPDPDPDPDPKHCIYELRNIKIYNIGTYTTLCHNVLIMQLFLCWRHILFLLATLGIKDVCFFLGIAIVEKKAGAV